VRVELRIDRALGAPSLDERQQGSIGLRLLPPLLEVHQLRIVEEQREAVAEIEVLLTQPVERLERRPLVEPGARRGCLDLLQHVVRDRRQEIRALREVAVHRGAAHAGRDRDLAQRGAGLLRQHGDGGVEDGPPCAGAASRVPGGRVVGAHGHTVAQMHSRLEQ